MDQDKTDPAQRPQTLLEAAKAIVAIHGTTWPDFRWYDLRAAIAREEAKVHVPLRGLAMEAAARIDAEMIGMLSPSDAKATLVTALDRAQQAEASAAWWKSEGERLSAELAKAKEFRSYAEEAANFGGKWRERAEKAESERNLTESQLALSLERLDRQSVLIRSATQASGCHIPEDVSDSIRSIRARAEKAEAELARMGRQLARLVELQVNPPVMVAHPFEGDPQTCAFGSNAFRGNREVAESDDDDEDPVDPTTGLTFTTYRRLLEALGGKS